MEEYFYFRKKREFESVVGMEYFVEEGGNAREVSIFGSYSQFFVRVFVNFRPRYC